MKNRFRIRYDFWLETDKPDHLQVAETIGQLKAERTFASVVRDGIMLVSRLRVGDIDLLLRLFPWVEQAILERHKGSNGGPDGGELDKLRQELDVLRQWVMNIPPDEKQPPIAASGAGRTRPQRAADTDDDALLVVRQAQSDGKSSALNFLNSVDSLQ